MALAEATVRVTIEVTRFERDLRQQVQKAADQAGKDFDKSMRASVTATGKNVGKDFAKSADLGSAGRQAGREFMAGVETQVRAAAGRAGERAGDEIGKGTERSSNRAGTNAGRAFAGGFRSSFIANNPIAALGVGLGAAFSTELGPATSILASFPGLLTAVSSAALVTVAAFKGVGTAIKAIGSGDIEKINASMAKLSPNAQAFVREFTAAGPAFESVKKSIQDAFFGQLLGQMNSIAFTLSGPLRNGLVQVANSAGALGSALIDAFTEARGVDNLNASFRGTSTFLDRLIPGIKSVTRGFLDFVGAAAPGLSTIGDAFGGLLDRFGQFLTRSAQSGQALVWVEEGVQGMRDLTREIGELLRALLTIVQAVRPLAAGFGLLLDVAEQLVGVFGQLPGPLQTAALAALLFSRTGLAARLREATGAANPLTRAVQNMGNQFLVTRDRVAGLQVVTGGAAAASRALGSAVDTAAAAATRFGSAARSGVLGAVGAVDTAIGRTANSIQTGFVRATLTANAAIEATSNALRNGLTRAASVASTALDRAAISINGGGTALGTAVNRGAIEANAALTRVADAASRTAAEFRGGLIPAALAIDRATVTAGAAVSRFASGLVGRLESAATSTAGAVSRIGSSLQSGFVAGTAAATAAASRFSTAVQTGVVRAAIEANTALSRIGTSLSSGLLRPLVSAQAAYATTASSVRAFTAAQSALNAPLGTTPTLLSRLSASFTGLNAIAQGSGAALRTAFAAPLAAVGAGMNGLAATAAGLGKSLASGLGSAVSGIVGALGGPWGVAITAATVALSLLSSSQDQAKQAAAEHQAQIAKLADTLDKQTGAVTAATKQQLLQSFANNSAGDSARKLGISLSLVADAASGNVGAQDQLYASLRRSAEATLQATGNFEDFKNTAAEVGLPIEVLENALLGNAGAVDQARVAFDKAGVSFDEFLSSTRDSVPNLANVGAAVGDTSRELFIQQQRMREVANAMTPAERTARQLTDAMRVLADKTSDADAKARALATAMNLLSGGTVPAEIAQARFTEVLNQLNKGLAESVKGLDGMGAGLVTTEGRINTASGAGAFLTQTYDQLSTSLQQSAASTLAAGQATGDLQGAYQRIAVDTQKARDQFVQTATSLGLSSEAANRLADSYGLIPSQVLTTVTTGGTAENTQFQVQSVYDKLKNLPPNTPVTVTGLTDDAIKKLNEVGIKTERLPDGKIKVTADTSGAISALQGVIRQFQNRVITFLTGGKALGDIVENKHGNVMRYASGGMRTMSPRRAEIVKPNTWRIIGDRAIGDEAFIPINNAHRSRALLAETARRMGFSLMADGDVRAARKLSTGSSTTIAAGAIVVNAPFADPALVAKATLNALAREAVA